MEVLDIYRYERDGSLSWVTDTKPVRMARAIIRSLAIGPSQEFLIRNDRTNERIRLRADGHWLPSKHRIANSSDEEQQKRSAHNDTI